MANIIRSAKSGSEWTSTELNAYNITTRSQDAATFFEVPNLPQPGVDNEVLTVDVQALDLQGVNASTIEFASLLDSAMVPVGTDNLEESAVDDFAVVLLRVTGYINGYRFARTRKDIPLLICGQWRHAKTDVCLVDRRQGGILLLVQEDKRQAATVLDAPAQLIAEAIAAFSYNNAIREDAGLEPLDADVIPGIVMVGTYPAFYKIPVTSQLVYNVRNGLYPEQPTIVTFHHPEVPRPNRRRSEGMKPLDNRAIIFRCYEAFKAVVGI